MGAGGETGGGLGGLVVARFCLCFLCLETVSATPSGARDVPSASTLRRRARPRRERARPRARETASNRDSSMRHLSTVKERDTRNATGPTEIRGRHYTGHHGCCPGAATGK